MTNIIAHSIAALALGCLVSLTFRVMDLQSVVSVIGADIAALQKNDSDRSDQSKLCGYEFDVGYLYAECGSMAEYLLEELTLRQKQSDDNVILKKGISCDDGCTM